jgi:hypothetical protein
MVSVPKNFEPGGPLVILPAALFIAQRPSVESIFFDSSQRMNAVLLMMGEGPATSTAAEEK